MSREEKEQCVIRLYKEGKTIRQIAKLVHMSFSGIGAIKRKAKLETDGEDALKKDGDIKSKSKFVQAMNLFSELESPVDVAIALDLSADGIKAMYLQYWELKGMYGLAQICEENKYDVHDLLKLHKIIKDHGMEKQDIINVLEFVKYNQLRTPMESSTH
jgi:transposase